MILQVFADAGYGAAGANARHEYIDLAFGVGPNFRSGGGYVGSRIGGIDELAGNETVRDFRRELLGLRDGSLHAFGAFGEHQFGAVGLHEQSAFDRHGFGHGDNQAIPTSGSDRCETDARISAGGFDDYGVGGELAGRFGVVDHCFRNAVFDRACRIEVLKFNDNLRLEVEVFFDVG